MNREMRWILAVLAPVIKPDTREANVLLGCSVLSTRFCLKVSLLGNVVRLAKTLRIDKSYD